MRTRTMCMVVVIASSAAGGLHGLAAAAAAQDLAFDEDDCWTFCDSEPITLVDDDALEVIALDTWIGVMNAIGVVGVVGQVAKPRSHAWAIIGLAFGAVDVVGGAITMAGLIFDDRPAGMVAGSIAAVALGGISLGLGATYRSRAPRVRFAATPSGGTVELSGYL